MSGGLGGVSKNTHWLGKVKVEILGFQGGCGGVSKNTPWMVNMKVDIPQKYFIVIVEIV